MEAKRILLCLVVVLTICSSGSELRADPLLFKARADYDVALPVSVAMGDLNGDGRLDMAVANFPSAAVSVHLGNGDGSLRTAMEYATGGAQVSAQKTQLTPAAARKTLAAKLVSHFLPLNVFSIRLGAGNAPTSLFAQGFRRLATPSTAFFGLSGNRGRERRRPS